MTHSRLKTSTNKSKALALEGTLALDLSQFPLIAETQVADWPHDQQVQHAAVVTTLRDACRRWFPEAADDNALLERLARGFAFIALHGLRDKLNRDGLLPDEDLKGDFAKIAQSPRLRG
jgi:hypothetical protein